MQFVGGRRQYENREKNVFKEGRLKKPEIIRMDEDSAQGCFPNQAQVIRGENGGTTQQGGGCGEKWGSFETTQTILSISFILDHGKREASFSGGAC